jgi:hypothetical protein
MALPVSMPSPNSASFPDQNSYYNTANAIGGGGRSGSTNGSGWATPSSKLCPAAAAGGGGGGGEGASDSIGTPLSRRLHPNPMDKDFPDPVKAEELSSVPVLDLSTYIHVVRMLSMKRYGSHMPLSRLFSSAGVQQVRMNEEEDAAVTSEGQQQPDCHLGTWRDCPYVPLAYCPERSVGTLFTLNKALLVQLFKHNAQPCKTLFGHGQVAGRVITFDGLKKLSRQCDLHRYGDSAKMFCWHICCSAPLLIPVLFYPYHLFCFHQSFGYSGDSSHLCTLKLGRWYRNRGHL